MDSREEIREKAVQSTCKRCNGATEVIFPKKGVDITMMVLTFLVLGFGCSIFKHLGADKVTIMLTVIVSIILGGIIGSIIYWLFRCYAGIKLCRCRSPKY